MDKLIVGDLKIGQKYRVLHYSSQFDAFSDDETRRVLTECVGELMEVLLDIDEPSLSFICEFDFLWRRDYSPATDGYYSIPVHEVAELFETNELLRPPFVYVRTEIRVF